jgi:dipeptidyl aminopeptidase/acylaminoacyl peptidase
MNKRIRIALAVLAFGPPTLLAQAPALVQPDAPTPSAREAELGKQAAAIIDAFTDGAAVFTRDGKKVVFVSNRDGLPQLYVADAANPDAPATRLVKTTERIPAVRALPDGKTLLFRSDHGADENWSFFLCGLDGSSLRELTPGAKMQRDDAIVPDGMPQTVFYSARVLSDSGSALYSVALAGGASEKKIYADELPGAAADVSRDGKRALWVRFPSESDNTLLLVDVAKGTAKAIYPPPGGPKVHIFNARFSPDGRSIFTATDAGGEQSLLFAFDASGKELARYTETHPATADIEDTAVSKDGRLIALSLGAGNHNEVRLLDAKTMKPAVEVAMPLGTGGLGDFSEDGKLLTATWSTPDAPGEIYAIDTSTGKASALRREARPSLAALPKVRASIVDVPAFDGLKLPTNLYLPDDIGDKKLPVLVVYHGGPAGSSQIRWSTTVRFFTGLGYAVVEPNVRGSGGFGRSFEMADNGPKRLDAFKDIETTARWAASQPWVDKNRMVVYGGSYGGYTVLIALERWPDIWKAGVDLFGVANMTTFLQSTSGLIREVFKVEFGDLDKDAPFLKTISPIEEVDKIVDPVFVYAGANDPRVPRPESDQVVRALRGRGVPVEYMVADNEGHSLARRENQIAFYSRCGRFLETQLAPK